ncbi:hypothetical protein BDV95DRAFT_483789 [Massariosphaeria phaeospora]|uniref:Uncharacterized protein n=1 Tax=Massariosphaeria phaeospora TaxID=100035 RepID=A0A7C8MSV6_9PLEO|nr:hypothetical protein BDV95DRAFT_483789 [Massariosphaeria phaeospora]
MLRDPVPAVAPTECLRRTFDVAMAEPHRKLYFNKESAKVNASLATGPARNAAALNISHAFSSPNPVVSIDFSQLHIPRLAPRPKPSTATLVHRLVNPPPHAFTHGSLALSWVVGVAGPAHFACRWSDGRFVLTRDSALRKEGRKAGLPGVYWEWLCGDDEELSSAELGVCLTREFFEGERR